MGYHLTTPDCEAGCTSKTAYPRLARCEAGLRFLTTSQGRWLSRDPITQSSSAAQERLVAAVRCLMANDRLGVMRDGEWFNGIETTIPEVITALLRNCPLFAMSFAGHSEYGFCGGQPTGATDNDGAFAVLEVVVVVVVVGGVVLYAHHLAKEKKAAEEKDFDGKMRYMVRECVYVNKKLVIGALNGPPLPGPVSETLHEFVTEALIHEGEKRAAEGFWDRLFSEVKEGHTSSSTPVDYLKPLPPVTR